MIKWLLITTVTGSLATLLVILFKGALVRRLGGSWYYYMCLLTIVLYVVPIRIPITFDSPHSVFTRVNHTISEVTDQQTSLTNSNSRIDNDHYAADSIAGALPSPSYQFPLPTLEQCVIAIWMLGAIFILSRSLVNYYRYKRKVIQSAPIDKVGNLDVVVSAYVHSPMLIGFVKPTIVIPNMTINKEDYKLALLHELNHYKQGDTWIKLFAVVINSLHWFNPVAYLATSNLSEACEYSCDEKITKGMGVNERKQYGEMILTFASHVSTTLSCSLVKNKTQLYRRLELIMKNSSKTRRYTGTSLVSLMIALSVITTSVVFAEGTKPLVEYGGAMKTYYNVSQTLEENVRSTLNIGQVEIRVVDAPFYIDADGNKLDLFNRTQPYYKISREWKENKPDLQGLTRKSLAIEGKNVQVAFSDDAAAYKDDPVIEKMIRNQITFELNYDNKKYQYDHQLFVNELIARGVYVIWNVTEPKDFQYEIREKANGDKLGKKLLTSYDQKNKVADIFNGKANVRKNINGNQGTQIGENFVIKQGETLAIDIKETTDKMPTINWAIVHAATGEVVDWMPNVRSGYRYIYSPGKNFANSTFKVVVSSEEDDDHAEIEVFIYEGTA